jgi:hypothetical protein
MAFMNKVIKGSLKVTEAVISHPTRVAEGLTGQKIIKGKFIQTDASK